MNRELWRKATEDARLVWLATAVGLFAVAGVSMAVNAGIEMGRFATILENLPDSIERLSPVPFKDLLSYEARFALVFEEPLMYLLLTAWCISRASDTVSGPIGRGTMEMLLAQPVSRFEALWVPTAVTLIGTVLLTAVTWLGMWAGLAASSVQPPQSLLPLPFPFAELAGGVADPSAVRVPALEVAPIWKFIPPAMNFCALGIFLVGICTLLSACDRYRWRTIGIMVAFYVLQMLCEIVGQMTERFSWLANITFFRAYDPVSFVTRSVTQPAQAWSWVWPAAVGPGVVPGPLALDAILIGLGTLALAAATFVFCRRDIPAPL